MKRQGRMYIYRLLACVALGVAGCVSQPPASGPSTAGNPSPAADNIEGQRVARHLAARYANLDTSCRNNPTDPAFLCSGVMLRGTAYSPEYHSWVPNPNSPLMGGVSFSFLRADSKFRSLAYSYTHGFIVYPLFDNPSSVVDLEILCGFPMDANSENRVAFGCGANRLNPETSKPCQAQGITTSAQWLERYRAPGAGDSTQRQCGFTLETGTANSAAIFMQLIDSMALLGEESMGTQNELIVLSWGATPNKVGVEAFFYRGGTDGLADSQKEQKDFYETVHVWRPLIRMTLPQTPADQATFTYVPSEQAVF
jgi:hypothetical protein